MELYLDNIVFTIQQVGGVSVYWYELLKGICNSGLRLHFLNANHNGGNLLEQQLDYRAADCIRESRVHPALLRYLPLRYKLPPGAVFHSGYLRVSPQKDILNILTIHDFAHERRLVTRFPRGLVNTTQKAYGIRHADGIICISEHTRSDLFHFYPDTDPNRVCVIHHGLAHDFFPVSKQPKCPLPLDLWSRYVLYVGARRRYKNFNTALRTMELLPACYQLVVVGGEPWTEEEITQLEKHIPGRYLLLPAVATATLNILYNYAFCFFYPSLYEGFGFPPGEAMKAGCAVVCTRAAAIPEVVGDAALMPLAPTPAAFARKIMELEHPERRHMLRQRGLEQAARFSWDKTVQETIAFYHHCWEHKFQR
ncbi:glycosyltransferase family 4 protein [Chitinophaga vietnamensis]|uniref:glycosyltransferase family 4 protein n=1 Tax=Chitinophaga vietnamensis TaxID=2593957 RepID=UPI00117863E6|nr:glycosyltransferase family 1 protein [Chitinophaga vietnamensis]